MKILQSPTIKSAPPIFGQPVINRGGAAFGGVEVLPDTHPNYDDFLYRSTDPNPWPQVTGNTAGFMLPADEGFLRLPQLVVSMPNSISLGVPAAGQRQPSVRRLLFPALPPGG